MAGELIAPRPAQPRDAWRCLHCRSSLEPGPSSLGCGGCGTSYPMVAGIPILVPEPAAYFRAERGALLQAAAAARQRRTLLEGTEPYASLPDPALRRHRDVIEAEIAQAETVLALLGVPGGLAEAADESQAVRPGWGFDTLMPYL